MTLQSLAQSSKLALSGQLNNRELFDINYEDNEDWQLLQHPVSKGSLVVGTGSVKVNDDFVFAVTDQELEINHIEPSLILSTIVTKANWIKRSAI